jgi:hypothetical protein
MNLKPTQLNSNNYVYRHSEYARIKNEINLEKEVPCATV